MRTDLLIVGAGPVGLEAALFAQKLGLSAFLIDKHDVGSVISRTIASKYFHHAYAGNTATFEGELSFPDGVLGSELITLWQKQVQSVPHIFGTELLSLERSEARYCAKTSTGEIAARYVLLATGMFAEPRRLEIPGENLHNGVLHEYDYDSPPYDRRVVIFGGGNSAVEAALDAAKSCPVTLLVRSEQFDLSVTARNRTLLSSGKITLLMGYTAEYFEKGMVHGVVGGKERELDFDTAYVQIGYISPSGWLRSLGLTLSSAGSVEVSRHFETSLPCVFAAGALAGAVSITHGAMQARDIVSFISRYTEGNGDLSRS